MGKKKIKHKGHEGKNNIPNIKIAYLQDPPRARTGIPCFARDEGTAI
jgi:hypothetical protein